MNWEKELYGNINARIGGIGTSLSDTERAKAIDAIILEEAKKLQSKYKTVYTASDNILPWNARLHGTLQSLYDQFPNGSNEENNLAKAFMDGFRVGLNVGTWNAAMEYAIAHKTIVSAAKKAQEAGGYAADEFTTLTLEKGTKIYGMTPGQTSWYTNAEMVEKSGYSFKNMYNGLQIKPHEIYGYRKYVTVYEVTDDITVATGKALANTSAGSGGYTQFFIKNFEKVLKPIEEILLQ